MVSEYGVTVYTTSKKVSLNPCFGGIWSLRFDCDNWKRFEVSVLILVLVGYGL